MCLSIDYISLSWTEEHPSSKGYFPIWLLNDGGVDVSKLVSPQSPFGVQRDLVTTKAGAYDSHHFQTHKTSQ